MAREADESAPLPPGKSDRDGRRAEQRAISLRANLQRRKRQQRARAKSQRGDANDGAGGETGDETAGR